MAGKFFGKLKGKIFGDNDNKQDADDDNDGGEKKNVFSAGIDALKKATSGDVGGALKDFAPRALGEVKDLFDGDNNNQDDPQEKKNE